MGHLCTCSSTVRARVLHTRCWGSKSLQVYLCRDSSVGSSACLKSRRFVGPIPTLGTFWVRSSMVRTRVSKARGGRSSRSGPACALIAQLDQSATLRRWRLTVQIGLGALTVMETVAQWAECLAVNEKVAGSWPAGLPCRICLGRRNGLSLIKIKSPFRHLPKPFRAIAQWAEQYRRQIFARLSKLPV